ncbi:inovirus Gp2 family protein [Salmonella enterica subsp. enterica]|nr:inovirus Gp2 family protein [Salmonella enterica subsp. enterica serovar Aba]ECY4263050.1 inovirus Gp2 family protein [Salmonella enterica subsp. enterica serovar Aba]
MKAFRADCYHRYLIRHISPDIPYVWEIQKEHSLLFNNNLIQGYGPYNEHYLKRLEHVLLSALDEHPRTLAIRFDLHLSPAWNITDTVCCYPNLSGTLLSRFIDSLKAKIQHYRSRLLKAGRRAHRCRLRYFWVREINTSVYPHYYVVLFLNKDLFRGLGDSDNPKSLWRMIQAAWLSALRLREYDEYRSLVEFPENATYVLDTSSNDHSAQLRQLAFRLSYLAKEHTKVYSSHERSMGCSQR